MLSYLDRIPQAACLTAAGKAALIAVSQREEYPKHHEVLRPGAVCHHVYFIEQGLTRTFYLKDGKDITDWLSPEHTFACSIVSFLTGRPDIRGIETLEPTIAYALLRSDLERLYQTHHDIERFGRLLVSDGLVSMQGRFDALHFASAAQRYGQLMEQYPDLALRVPLGILASYLGMTQETLSRIRSKAAVSRK